MKKITTAAGVFGPYQSVQALADRYLCDGAELPFSVVGEGVIADVGPGDFPPPPAPPPAERQSAAWERIKTERDRRRFEGGAKVGQHWFLSSQQAVGEYTALILMGSAFPPGTVLRPGWRTMVEGVTVDMTAALATQILGAGFQAIAAIDDVAQAHRAAMEASATPESYDFSGGWPVAFWERPT